MSNPMNEPTFILVTVYERGVYKETSRYLFLKEKTMDIVAQLCFCAV
jgi:hypothetical protein